MDLKDWRRKNSNEVSSFLLDLSNAIPSLKEHKCMAGKPGGFLREVQKGTSFAHVIEHVILELIHLADPQKQTYTGWTREQVGNHQRFVIHYSAPNFLTGRLAAILSVELVKRLIGRETVDANQYVELLKQPVQYFTQKEQVAAFERAREPISVIQQIEEASVFPSLSSRKKIKLSKAQEGNISSVLQTIRKHFNYITEAWRNSFLEYSGNFGKAIIDKMELLNIDKFIDCAVSGEFERFYQGIRKASRLISSYRIPLNFIIHSIWLYKNRLQTYLIEEYRDNRAFLDQTIKDFDDFFQMILHSAVEGFSDQASEGGTDRVSELETLRELRERKGSIMVVDDDEIIRSACRDILEYQGYWAVLAKDAGEALEILANKKEEISLAILNISLPDMNLEEIFSRLRQLYPEVRILIMTSYSVSEDQRKMFTRGPVDFIKKPFTAESLGEKIHSLLGQDTKVTLSPPHPSLRQRGERVSLPALNQHGSGPAGRQGRG